VSPLISRRKLVWGFIAILAIVHFDFWAWTDRSLVMGFMPTGLMYQASISLAAGLGWFLVVKFAWPDRIETWADEPVGGASEGNGEGNNDGNDGATE
jgi:hypothetical protein